MMHLFNVCKSRAVCYLLSGIACLSLYSCIGGPIKKETSDFYRKRFNTVYFIEKSGSFTFFGNKVEGADGKTFLPLAPMVGVDKDAVYYKVYKQPQVDRATFLVKEDGTMRDKDHIYIPDFANGGESRLRILYNVDLETYGIYKDHVSWGYDKDHIYYRYSQPVDVDRATFTFLSGQFMKDKNFIYVMGFDHLKKRNANTDSIIVVNDRYLRDNKSVYFSAGNQDYEILDIPFIHADSIRALQDPFIAIDGKIYSKGHLLNGGEADVASFQVLDDYYSKDKKQVFCNDTMVGSVDIESFQALKDGMAKDKNAVYFWGKKLDGVDVNTFKVINPVYFVDAQHVYIIRPDAGAGKFFFIVEGADPTTFQSDDNKGMTWGHDKKNKFYNGLLVIE